MVNPTEPKILNTVFLVSEFSLRYQSLIFEDQILVVDIRMKILRCASEMILRPEDNSHSLKKELSNTFAFLYGGSKLYVMVNLFKNTTN